VEDEKKVVILSKVQINLYNYGLVKILKETLNKSGSQMELKLNGYKGYFVAISRFGALIFNSFV
jgi:hypothetical protein